MRDVINKVGWQLKGVLPRPVYIRARDAWRAILSKEKARQRETMPRVERAELVAALAKAGIAAGDVVFVHSALSKIGDVDGGAQTVVDAIMEAVTDKGTVVMPTFMSAEDFIADSNKGIVLDLREKPSVTGKITEAFRTSPGVLRSSHPFSSCGAWGRYAQYLVSDHANDPRICHKDSPFARVLELNGKIVGLGTDVGTITLYHCAEDLWDAFPVDVYTPPFVAEYIDAQGKHTRREVVRHNPVVARDRIDHPSGEWIRDRFRTHLKQRGILSETFTFGCAPSWTMDANQFVEEVKALARAGVTIYSRPSDNVTVGAK